MGGRGRLLGKDVGIADALKMVTLKVSRLECRRIYRWYGRRKTGWNVVGIVSGTIEGTLLGRDVDGTLAGVDVGTQVGMLVGFTDGMDVKLVECLSELFSDNRRNTTRSRCRWNAIGVDVGTQVGMLVGFTDGMDVGRLVGMSVGIVEAIEGTLLGRDVDGTLAGRRGHPG